MSPATLGFVLRAEDGEASLAHIESSRIILPELVGLCLGVISLFPNSFQITVTYSPSFVSVFSFLVKWGVRIFPLQGN